MNQLNCLNPFGVREVSKLIAAMASLLPISVLIPLESGKFLNINMNELWIAFRLNPFGVREVSKR